MATISKKFKVKQNDGSFQEVLVASTSDQVYFKNNITLETKYNELVAKDIDLQNQIRSNDTDITNLQNKDTDLQNQINSNDTDSTATIIDKINTHDAQLPQIETNANTIAIIQQQIGASATEGSEATGLYLLIQNLQNQILLLENRVSLLENPSTEEPVEPETPTE